MAFAASSDFGVRLRRIFLRAVPPSAPFIPLSAKSPRACDNSVVPPFKFFAVPPIVNMASPSWATDVFDLDDAFAILSTSSCVSSRLNPRADCASVTISDASASSIPPAAARLRTFGNIFMEVAVSYPASAI